MAKRLNTEIKFKNGGFKVKIGTTNRLKPNTIYIDLGGYIIPNDDKSNYDEDVYQLDKMLNKNIKKQLLYNEFFDKKYICVVETAQDRMKIGKSSYISLQCHLKQSGNLNVNDIIDAAKIFTNDLCIKFIDIIEYNGFSVKN